ncbi:MAG: pseudouridine synthase [Bacteroidota bacterium]
MERRRSNRPKGAGKPIGGKRPSNKRPEKPPDPAVRLNRFIASAGVCSRRDADELIRSGQIKINGKIVTELGTKVNPGDRVFYKGKALTSERTQYVLLNKPKDFITTVSDPHDRKTVMALVENACPERIYPVGRLDRHTTGLLLLTNDGDLAKKLTHPSHKVKKIYQVELDRPITTPHFEEILGGLELEDGKVMVDELAVIGEGGHVLGIEIHVGKNRIVRRIFEHLGYKITKLDRVMFGPLTKKDLPRGKWRHLGPKEILALKSLVGKNPLPAKPRK